MYCGNCGHKLTANSSFCGNCGKKILRNSRHQKKTFVFVVLGLVAIIFFLGYRLLTLHSEGYFYSESAYNQKQVDNNKIQERYSTIIESNHFYTDESVKSEGAAKKLISQDSVSQKASCPQEIVEIENSIISKYNITAVNLCEMDIELARELEKVIDYVYTEYPIAREYLTNITLVNPKLTDNYIAYFTPAVNFNSNSISQSYKIMIALNAKYYLNKNKFQILIAEASSTGHFPNNATIYSPLAHELGHYLSYIVAVNKYLNHSNVFVRNNNAEEFSNFVDDFNIGKTSKQMIELAYKNYLNKSDQKLSFDAFRASISSYALSKDNNGNYMYDETVAEAFHDCYLNGENAKDASKEIVSILKEELGGIHK